MIDYISQMVSGALAEWGYKGIHVDNPHPRVVSDADPKRILRALQACLANNSDIFILSPEIPPDSLAKAITLSKQQPESRPQGPLIVIQTGGSGGRMKFAAHSLTTFFSAAQAQVAHLGDAPHCAVSLLPMWHVSGLMPVIRASITGGELMVASAGELNSGTLPDIGNDKWSISLVPTQLKRLMESPDTCRWLGRFNSILLGGAPAQPELLENVRTARLPVIPVYGMSETAAFVAAQPAEDFLQAAPLQYTPIQGTALGLDDKGHIVIRNNHIFHGYWPELSAQPLDEWVSGDIGEVDAEGRLTLRGRADRIIISGGEKVDPAHIEAVIRENCDAADACVTGVTDPHWGQRLVAAVEHDGALDEESLRSILAGCLTPFEIPKQFISYKALPRTAAGKVDAAKIQSDAG